MCCMLLNLSAFQVYKGLGLIGMRFIAAEPGHHRAVGKTEQRLHKLKPAEGAEIPQRTLPEQRVRSESRRFVVEDLSLEEQRPHHKQHKVKNHCQDRSASALKQHEVSLEDNKETAVQSTSE